MTVQLSKQQIEALKVELARYGLEIRPAPKPRKGKDQLSIIRAWKPETSAGRACKSAMIKWQTLAVTHPIKGVTSYERGACYPYRNHTAAKIAAWYAMPHDTRCNIVAAIREVRKQFDKAETRFNCRYPADRENPEHRARLAATAWNYRHWRRALRVATTDPADMAGLRHGG